jgi:hypothetical protein
MNSQCAADLSCPIGQARSRHRIANGLHGQPFALNRGQQNRYLYSANDMTRNIGTSLPSRFARSCRRLITQIPIARRLSPAVPSLEACQTPAR